VNGASGGSWPSTRGIRTVIGRTSRGNNDQSRCASYGTAHAHDWTKDPLSRTTWMTRRPGQLTRDLAGLQQPAGVVHFASSDNASLWGGFIDGAIESGLREARQNS
jgi:monoamine oxidase